MSLDGIKYLVVGAGFFGAVVAERIANDLGERVLVIDRRTHIGGNSYSEPDSETGIEVHRYGSHIFHTRHGEVWEYVTRFSGFNTYRHKVLTRFGDRVFRMPINLSTINDFYGLSLSPSEAREFLRSETAREGILEPANLEEKAVASIGRPLYEAFIKGYTHKQWERDPRELPASIISRLPVRFSYNDDYFSDPWQGIPTIGYGALFRRLLAHERIEVRLGLDFFDIREQIPAGCSVIYTGPIDRFFDYRHGQLGWRTLRFESEVLPVEDHQGTAVMNYADADVPYTRVHEFRHYHPERSHPDDRTVIFREYSTGRDAAADPYYPVNAAEDRRKLELYQAEAGRLPDVLFGGRLGEYRYLDMDQTILSALKMYDERIRPARRSA